MKTVDQLVSEWTEEEREKLKDLIGECREREKTISENSKRSRESLAKINESLQPFGEKPNQRASIQGYRYGFFDRTMCPVNPALWVGSFAFQCSLTPCLKFNTLIVRSRNGISG